VIVNVHQHHYVMMAMTKQATIELDSAWQHLYLAIKEQHDEIKGTECQRWLLKLTENGQAGHFRAFVEVAAVNRIKSEVDAFYASLRATGPQEISTNRIDNTTLEHVQQALFKFDNEVDRLSNIISGVNQLYRSVNAIYDCIDSELVVNNTLTFVTVHRDIGKLRKIFSIVLDTAVAILYRRVVREERGSDDEYDSGDNLDTEDAVMYDAAESTAIFEACLSIGRLANSLGLSERVLDPQVRSTLKSYMISYINEDFIKGCYEESVLGRIGHFVDAICRDLLGKITPPHSMERKRAEVRLLANKALCDARTEEIFDLIATPDSEPALEDLKFCLEQTAQHSKFVAYAREILRMRLLHPGADTSPILTQYVDAIKALRILDPSSQMVHAVCEPVQHALRQREDTIRCIVQSLTDTDDKKGLLSDAHTPTTKTHARLQGVDIEIDDWENWQPTPMDASGDAKTARTADIMTMLAGIYGSQEHFVNEYQLLLSARLLDALDYQIDDERRNLELLKVRFGETNLHQCEVMLKDIHNSRRINEAVHELLIQDSEMRNNDSSLMTTDDVPVDLTIISRLFWPQLKNHTLILPEKVNRWLEEYEESYSKFKQDRRLAVKPGYGRVDLSLTFDEWELDVTVLPDQAAIILCFESKDVLTVEELSTMVGLAQKEVRRRIGFWESLGVLVEVSHGEYRVQETKPSQDTRQRKAFHMGDEIDVDDAAESMQIELETCWNYIEAMLVQMESLTVENIHMRLQMFFSGDPPPLNRLKAYLDDKVLNDVLEYRLSEYHLTKQ
ncbi:hypothetical protein SARC_09944, partial [Sphaeroforma arctica JP610]